jgi:Na+/proline symporter
LIAAIYAASMSAVSGGINSLTSASLVDFYQRLWPEAARDSEARQLKLAKILTVTYGALVVGLAFVVQKLGSLIEASNKVIGLVGGPLLGLFILGMLSRRANAPGAAIGWAAGVAILVPICYSTHTSFLWYTLIGFAVTTSVGWCASSLFPRPQPKQLEGVLGGQGNQQREAISAAR